MISRVVSCSTSLHANGNDDEEDREAVAAGRAGFNVRGHWASERQTSSIGRKKDSFEITSEAVRYQMGVRQGIGHREL